MAFLPAVFAAYTAAQYVIGPEYQQLPGNNEQFFLQGSLSGREYADNPTAFLLIALFDLALAVPATLTAAFGLRSGALWGRSAAYAVVGFFAVVPLSVAAMSVTMVLRGDPNGSVAAAIGSSGAAIGFGLMALLLYRPLAGRRVSTVPEAWTEAHRSDH